VNPYSLDIHYFLAWFGLLHPPSIFTLFASPVEVLRRRRPHFSENVVFITLSIGLISYRREIVLVSLYSWFDFIIFERLFYEDVLVFEYSSLDIHYFMAWFGLLQSTVHLHSFRFAGGSLTAAAAAFL
jgi:hypothetical protein